MSSVAAAAPGTPQADELRVARRENLGLLVRSKSFVIGLFVVCFWVFCAFFGKYVVPHDPLGQSQNILVGPNSHYWFGTDGLGRDVFSRVIVGAQSVLKIAPAATMLALIAGTGIALVIGYYGGIVDDVSGRFIEAHFAVPGLIVTIMVVVAFGSSPLVLILIIAWGFTWIICRTMRAAVLAERNLEYVQAAQLRGERGIYVMFVEILPNIMGPVVVEGTVRMGYAIFAIAGLTFLGYGVQPPSPDWSLQITQNYALLTAGTYWWTVLFPALGIATIVVAINLVADAIAQVLER
jgi:peptide/nickel transport system permease protein